MMVDMMVEMMVDMMVEIMVDMMVEIMVDRIVDMMVDMMVETMVDCPVRSRAAKMAETTDLTDSWRAESWGWKDARTAERSEQ
jgi:hypothetical protein